MTNESKTLDELSKIEGAFDRGNMYKCTYTLGAASGLYRRGLLIRVTERVLWMNTMMVV